MQWLLRFVIRKYVTKSYTHIRQKKYHSASQGDAESLTIREKSVGWKI